MSDNTVFGPDPADADVVVLDEHKSVRQLRKEAQFLLLGRPGLSATEKRHLLEMARDKLTTALSLLDAAETPETPEVHMTQEGPDVATSMDNPPQAD